MAAGFVTAGGGVLSDGAVVPGGGAAASSALASPHIIVASSASSTPSPRVMVAPNVYSLCGAYALRQGQSAWRLATERRGAMMLRNAALRRHRQHQHCLWRVRFPAERR